MHNRHDSASNIFSIKKYPFSPLNGRYNIDVENSNEFRGNNLINSYTYYLGRHMNYHPPRNLRFNTNISTGNNQSNMNTNLNDNKTELKNGDIKMVIESIEDIKANQKELISAIKGLKFYKDNNKNEQNKEEEKEEKKNENEILSYIKNLKSEFESLTKEMSILKQKDLENQKIIESNKLEIENLKKNYLNKINDEYNNSLIEKDNKIKKLEESLDESKSQNKNLQQQLTISQDLNKKKEDEIKTLKKELNEFKVKSVNNNDLDKKNLTNILNKLNLNMELIKNSIQSNINPNLSANNVLATSISTFNVENNTIRQTNNGEYTYQNDS